MDDDNLATALLAQIQISIVLISMVKKASVEPMVLAKQWGTTLNKTQKTTQDTTQRGIWAMIHPSLRRWFITYDHYIHHSCVTYPLFSDMMFESTVSKSGNRCAQVCATDFGWARVFPITSRSDAHETLSLPFTWDGVPLSCNCNNAKESSKVCSIISSKRLHFSWNSWSHILPGQML